VLYSRASLATCLQLNISYAVVPWNTSSDKCHFMLTNITRAVFAHLSIFACLAFRAAQHGLGSFTSVENLSVHMRTTTVCIMIYIRSLIVFSLSWKPLFCVVMLLFAVTTLRSLTISINLCLWQIKVHLADLGVAVVGKSQIKSPCQISNL